MGDKDGCYNDGCQDNVDNIWETMMGAIMIGAGTVMTIFGRQGWVL